MSKRDVVMGLAIGLTSVAGVPRAHAAGQSCEQLAQLTLPYTKITSAETIAGGAFTQAKDMTPSLATLYKQLPAFCRVKAVATPSADSDIKIEVWLRQHHGDSADHLPSLITPDLHNSSASPVH